MLHLSRVGTTQVPFRASTTQLFSASRPELWAPGDVPVGWHSQRTFITSGNHFPLPIKPGRAWLLWPAERVPRCCLWITFYRVGTLSSGNRDARTGPVSFHNSCEENCMRVPGTTLPVLLQDWDSSPQNRKKKNLSICQALTPLFFAPVTDLTGCTFWNGILQVQKAVSAHSALMFLFLFLSFTFNWVSPTECKGGLLRRLLLG